MSPRDRSPSIHPRSTTKKVGSLPGRTTFRWCHAVAAALALTGCGGPLGPDDQGIQGIVLIGPQCPVQALQDPCPDLPYQVSIEVQSRGGGTALEVVSGEDGRFRIGLFPGFYTLHPESGNPFPNAPDQDVVVLDNEYTEVTINFDTGIR